MSLPDGRALQSSSLERHNPYASPDVYYGDDNSIRRQLLGSRGRAPSSMIKTSNYSRSALPDTYPKRRMSTDTYSDIPQRFAIDVDSTLTELNEREDTDNNYQITIDDHGPKNIRLGTAGSLGYRTSDINGNYAISNLLQELTLAQDLGHKRVIMDRARLNENPVDRLSRRIRDEFWPNLTRVIDGSVIEKAGKDSKDWTGDPRPRIYVPRGAPEQYEYYQKVAQERPEIRLDVQWLPVGAATPEWVRDAKPGLLALEMEKVAHADGTSTLRGLPFIVPGGRFNELYYWDSYMESLGLIENGRVDLAKTMVKNFAFCIKHYGKILNANRSYYLCRSQPPFLTDMALKVYDRIQGETDALDFLRNAILAAIKEYYSVWVAEPRYDPITGLSRYRPEGLGIPPETEASHFTHLLEPYAKKHKMSFDEFVHAYNCQQVSEPELDAYFLHDRAVRESGHDTSYRLEGLAADLATVDLNSLLYKYEKDIATVIYKYFGDRLPIPVEFQTSENRLARFETSATWDRRAQSRKFRMTKYMWSEEEGMFFDYDTVKKARTTYESATTFWTMWAECATPKQAASLVLNGLRKFEMFGGLVSGTEKSRGQISLSRPNRQWDYPFGWAPQQILAWKGLANYGYKEEAQRLAYKWLYMVTRAFVDFNGVVVEKYNVTREMDPHKVEAEYGNQGSDFKGVPREGFGWVNASYVVGLTLMGSYARRALGWLTPWETFDKQAKKHLEGVYLGEEAQQETIREEGQELLEDDDGEEASSGWVPTTVNGEAVQ